MSETKLIVIRHGQTLWNLEERWQGHSNIVLTEKGLAQAQAAAARLAGQKFAAIYCSDLDRAVATAQPIAEATGLVPIPDDRLRERNLGVFEGLVRAEMQERYPEDYQRLISRVGDHVIPGGESRQQLSERIMACFEELAARHVGETLVVVTHGGVINVLFREVVGLSVELPTRFQVLNVALNTFAWAKGKWTLVSFGDIQHLLQN